MAILVIAEHHHQLLRASTYSTITAAHQLGEEVDILIAGHEIQTTAEEAAKISGVREIFTASDPGYAHLLAENMANLVCAIAEGYSHILAPATTFGKDFMPRVAAILDVAQISDVIAILSDATFKRPIYAGNAIQTVTSTDEVKIITVRSTAFPKAELEGNTKITPIEPQLMNDKVKFVRMDETPSDRPELTAANIVVSGGRGIASKENFAKLEALADQLGAAVGASRAAVDAGYCPNDYQVGQTGKIVAPTLYIAFGISGAIQHLAGMKESKIIVAINKDENAPIFDIADYGYVGDLFDAMEAFTNAL